MKVKVAIAKIHNVVWYKMFFTIILFYSCNKKHIRTVCIHHDQHLSCSESPKSILREFNYISAVKYCQLKVKLSKYFTKKFVEKKR